MKKKPISMTLSTKSIQDAIKKLEQYRDSLQAKCDLLVSRLAQIGQTVAIRHISESPIGNTITVRVDKSPQLMTSNAILIATGKTVTSEDRELCLVGGRVWVWNFLQFRREPKSTGTWIRCRYVSGANTRF